MLFEKKKGQMTKPDKFSGLVGIESQKKCQEPRQGRAATFTRENGGLGQTARYFPHKKVQNLDRTGILNDFGIYHFGGISGPPDSHTST